MQLILRDLEIASKGKWRLEMSDLWEAFVLSHFCDDDSGVPLLYAVETVINAGTRPHDMQCSWCGTKLPKELVFLLEMSRHARW